MNKMHRKGIDVQKIKKFVLKHKILSVASVAIVLLACISVFISYAFYNITKTESIIGGKVGEIADLNVQIMVQNRDANGNAIEGYSLYPYIPRAGYIYNEDKSYCTNGSAINYEDFEATITSSQNDVCYLYFDSTASLDITLNIYAQDVNSDGEGIDQYTKLETTSLPSTGYMLKSSSCKNGSTVSYSVEDNLFSVETSGKDECDVYMDVLDVDIALKLFIQEKKGSNNYIESKEIPANIYYSLNEEKSSCTGSSTLSMNGQKVVISATSKTSCEAYLDIDSGPIIEEVTYDVKGQTLSLGFKGSNQGTIIKNWYYSIDGGKTYNNTIEASVNIPLDSIEEILVYATDSSDKSSAIISVNSYIYGGIFDYANTVQIKTIGVEGYYRLEIWGAEGGSHNETHAVGGKGGYSTGIVHLNVGDILYIHTGGKGGYHSTSTNTTVGAGGANGGGNAAYYGGSGGGGTDIRINQDSLYARVIVAGGGGGAYSYDSTYKVNGGAGGGFSGLSGTAYNSSYSTWAGGGATQTTGGSAGISSSTEYNGKVGTFGIGADTGYKYDDPSYYSSGAGGGGWYGGGSAGNYSSNSRSRAASGGGGSGYIYTESTAVYYPTGCLLNSNYYLTSASTIAGDKSFLSPTGVAETGHSGNGYAKITYVGDTLE